MNESDKLDFERKILLTCLAHMMCGNKSCSDCTELFRVEESFCPKYLFKGVNPVNTIEMIINKGLGEKIIQYIYDGKQIKDIDVDSILQLLTEANKGD